MIRRRDLRLAAVLRPIVRETPTPPTALCALAYARQLHDERDLPAGTFETQFTFAQALTESAKLARNCLLVVSLPASDTPGSHIAASSSRPDIPGNFWSLTTHAASLQASLAKTCSADSYPTLGKPAVSSRRHIKTVEDHRIPGMTAYPLDEVLLTVLTGLLCRMEDFDEIAMFGEEQLDWLRRFLPGSDLAPGSAGARSEGA
jgi:DDE family transposase